MEYLVLELWRRCLQPGNVFHQILNLAPDTAGVLLASQKPILLAYHNFDGGKFDLLYPILLRIDISLPTSEQDLEAGGAWTMPQDRNSISDIVRSLKILKLVSSSCFEFGVTRPLRRKSSLVAIFIVGPHIAL